MLFFSLTKEVRRLHQPKRNQIMAWLKAALVKKYADISIQIIIVTQQKSQQLNLAYRKQNKPTNVISLEYPNNLKELNSSLLIGELILCDAVILVEANEQNKSILEHYAHMIIHGMLHLQGFDHEIHQDAVIMEQLEVGIMAKFDFRNPYIKTKSGQHVSK